MINACTTAISNLAMVFSACALIAFTVSADGKAAAQPDSSAPVNAQSWSEILSLDDRSLESLLNQKDTQRQNIRARALLTRSMRSLNRSYPNATTYLSAASKYINAETDEAAFAQAMRCQVQHRQAMPGGKEQCETLDRLGFSVQDPSVLAYVRLTQSLYWSREGKHEKAEALAKESTVFAETARNNALIAQANNWLGVQYNIKHLPKLSLVHYEAAWEAVEALDWPEQKQIIRFNMAAIYPQLERHTEAMTIFEQSIDWPLFNVNATRRLVRQSAMTSSLIGIGDAVRAETELQKLVPELFDKVQNDTKILAYNSLGEAQLAQGKLSEALASFQSAIGLFDSTTSPNPRGQAVLVPYGGALRQAGRPAEALDVIDSVIEQLDLNSPNDLLRNAMLERAAILTDMGDSQGAGAAAREAQKVSDQLNSDALIYQISRLKTSIELEQSNQELALAREREAALEKEAIRAKTLRYLLLAMGGLLLAVGYLLFSRHLQARVAQTERAVNERLEEKVRLRTEQLEEQMADRMQAEVERRHLLGKLAEGEKMRALGQLTAGVAHDFNNLMTAVTLTTEYLKSSDENSRQNRDALLDDILSATDSAAKITGGLLAYARQQPLRPTLLQLDEFLEESTLIFRNSLGERNLLRTSFEPCRVKVDQGQLTSALLNLILNAKEAIGERGTVEVSLTTEARGPHTPEPYAVISVTDSGRGMGEEELKRATEPFYTTKPSGEGAGLGLSMVYGFARQSGGDLTLSSDNERGTQVQLRLPLAENKAKVERPNTVIDARELPSKLKVLVVEDRESVLNMLLRSLTHLGLVPQPAKTADEAKVLLDEGYVPELLLSDIMMPGEIDGHALAEYTQKLHPDLPIILMSGYADSIDSQFLFLRKPFNMEELEKTLAAALQEASDSTTQSAG